MIKRVVIVFTDYIPFGKQWFVDGLNEVDFRTTDRCVKNRNNRYQPVWLPDNSSIMDEVVKLIAKCVEIVGPQRAVAVNQLVELDDSFESRAKFGDIGNLPAAAAPANALGTAIDQVTVAVTQYLQHPKGYATLFLKYT